MHISPGHAFRVYYHARNTASCDAARGGVAAAGLTTGGGAHGACPVPFNPPDLK